MLQMEGLERLEVDEIQIVIIKDIVSKSIIIREGTKLEKTKLPTQITQGKSFLV